VAPAESLHLAEVAEAVGLREGARGVEEVLRQIHRLGAPPARTLSRRSGLPVPIVVAICGELRRRGLVDRRRPSHLTPMGRELASRLGSAGGVASTCAACSGSGIALSQAFATTRRRLEELLRGAPPAEPRLDQAHSTVDAKLRRVAYMEEIGALVGRSVLMLGDDDFMALALAVASSVVGIELPGRLVVLDVDAAVIGFTRTRLIELGVAAELEQHDLRRPLPEELVAAFDTVVTDPPYTRAGAELFLSRAADALRPGPGGQVLLSFGPKSPDESAALQHSITGMGFAIHRLMRNFNEYLGASVLGGVSHMYHLVGGAQVRGPISGGFAGPMYTAEL
jgi:N4-bis(aminopropyl)spermidine synthase